MARRGTEAFPDLGAHCDHEDCNQLDFLPFECDGCQKVFCTEHRAYKAHGCVKAWEQGRTVVVCEVCATSIEKKDGEDSKEILDKHMKSCKCDPAKKQKPRCPVRRCKEVLTFSNTSTCKHCNQKVCLKHRFRTDHVCERPVSALAGNSRTAVECGRNAEKKDSARTLPSMIRSIKIF